MFRLVSWNIRAGGGRRAAAILDAISNFGPDAVILSEFRATAPSQAIADGLSDIGPSHQINTTNKVEPQANALLIAANTPMRRIALRAKPEEPGRWAMVRLEAPKLALGAMHIPNQHTGRKPQFHDAVLDLARRWRGGPALMAGDTNSGQIGIDEERPVFNKRTHAWFDNLQDAGWVDAFRARHGGKREYTWYSPGFNNGFRLDQAFLSRELHTSLLGIEHRWIPCADSGRRDGVSDHAALLLDLHLPACINRMRRPGNSRKYP